MAEAYFFLGTINERLWNYSKAQEYYRQFAQKFPSAYVDRRWSAGPEYCGRLVHYLRPRLSSREYTELKERCEHSCLAVSQPTNANVRFFGLVAQRSSESTDSGFPLPKLVMPFAQPIFSNKQLIIPELPDNISFLRWISVGFSELFGRAPQLIASGKRSVISNNLKAISRIMRESNYLAGQYRASAWATKQLIQITYLSTI